MIKATYVPCRQFMSQQVSAAYHSYRAMIETIKEELRLLRQQHRRACAAMVIAVRERCARRLAARRQQAKIFLRAHHAHWRKRFEEQATRTIRLIAADLLEHVLGTATARELLKESPIATIISSRLATCEAPFSFQLDPLHPTLEWRNQHFSAQYSALQHATASLSNTSIACSVHGREVQITTHMNSRNSSAHV